MLPDGRSALFEGKLADYERLAKIAGFPNVLEHDDMNAKSPENGTKTAAFAPTSGFSEAQIKDLKRNRQKLATRVEQLEKTTAKIKAEIALLERALADLPPSDYAKARELHEQQSRLAKTLEADEERWLEAYSELEAANEQLAATGRNL